MSAVARRYAKAAVSAAREAGGEKGVEALRGGLEAFRVALEQSRELAELLTNPVFKNERVAALGAVLSRLGVDTLTGNLVRLLADRDRVAHLPQIAREVEHLADADAGRVRAYVTSAMRLTPQQEERIARALQRRLGSKVEVSVDVDATLLGGFVCRVGDLTLDTSLRRQLELLRERLEGRAHP